MRPATTHGGWMLPARLRLVAVLATLTALATACGLGGSGGGGDAGASGTMVIGGIPDQDVSVLEERFGGMADYLSGELGIDVEYRPSTSYAALVTAFDNGDVQLGWFGGLTGVQARLAVDGSRAIAQRPRDSDFRSVFIAGPGTEADSLEGLAGLSFTFGSESSTSGHLMPRHFLLQAGIDPRDDFDGRPGFSGSHDKTWKLVEAGSFQAGALNAAVWERAVDEGQVDTTAVRVVHTTPPYFDYHWVLHPDVDERFGAGTADGVEQALLEMHEQGGEAVRQVLDQFETERFIATDDSNYSAIEETARRLGLIGE